MLEDGLPRGRDATGNEPPHQTRFSVLRDHRGARAAPHVPNRVRPTRPGTAVFDDVECKSVWPEVQPPPLPNTPPRLSEFLKLLTQRGGYNHRATKAPADPEPFWIGLRHMLDFATAGLAFGPERANNVYQ